MRQIFVDTETTGLVMTEDYVVEVAAVAYEDRERVPEEEGGIFHRYCKPPIKMRAEAQAIHGLDDDFLADKPPFEAIADDFIQFIQGGEVIMHNAPFDAGFLDAEFKRLDKPPLEETTTGVVCSLAWARTHKPEIGSYSLGNLCRHYGIPFEQRDLHSALVDAKLLGDVYYRMRQQQGKIDMHTPSVVLEVSSTIQVLARTASAEEVKAHEEFLAQMEKDTGTAPLYKSGG